MLPDQLAWAAEHTDTLLAHLRAYQATHARQLGARDQSVTGDPRLAAALERCYLAWWLALDVILTDGRLTAAHLAATAQTTHATDTALRELIHQAAAHPPTSTTDPTETTDLAQIAVPTQIAAPSELAVSIPPGFVPGAITRALNPDQAPVLAQPLGERNDA